VDELRDEALAGSPRQQTADHLARSLLQRHY
jgi:hypothetical protein